MAEITSAIKIEELLEVFKENGERATIILRNGRSYSAKIKDTNHHSVLLTEPAGKEMSDVLIRTEEISSIEMRIKKKNKR